MARKNRKIAGQDIIKNMGLFWHRDKVRWRGDAGFGPPRLAGVRTNAKRKGEVNFWKQTGVYALYADYHLVYVGQAGLGDISCIGARLKTHLKDNLSGRWNMFSWFGLQRVRTNNNIGGRFKVKIRDNTELANVLEGIVIEVAEPPMNSQKGRFGKKVERFRQFDDTLDRETVNHERVMGAIAELDEGLKKSKKQLAKAIRRISK